MKLLFPGLLFLMTVASRPPSITPTYMQLSKAATACGYPKPTREVHQSFVKAVSKQRSAITTRIQLAMFLAQVFHESGGLQYRKELRCESNGCPGEYQTPGIDEPGRYYYGRGFIQLTWAANYRTFSEQRFGSASVLLQTPDLVAENLELSWGSALWYWETRVKTAIGQGQEFGKTTRAINGALECDGRNTKLAKKRYDLYMRILSALDIQANPIESGCY